MKKFDPARALQTAIQKAGSRAGLARAAGVSRQAVARWHEIPIGRVAAISRALEIPATQLHRDFAEANR